MAHQEHIPQRIRSPGRGHIHLVVLRARRRLQKPQPQRAPLEVPKETLGLGGHLLHQLRAIESERSFLREATRFFSHLFPGVG